MTLIDWADHSDAARAVAIHLLRHGPLARTDLARRLGLSTPSLTRLCRPLLELGLIREVGDFHDGKVGRPRQLLDIDPESGHFVGIKLRGSQVVAGLTNLRGEIVRQAQTDIVDPEPSSVVGLVAGLVAELGSANPVSGIGIGLAGVVRARSLVVDSPFLGWTDVDLAARVQQGTGIATLVDNDVVAFTEYEHWFGAGRDVQRFAVVTLGVGTGYGLVVNGIQVVNDDYGIGLVNHWPLDPTGPLCRSGHRGCVDSMLNSDSVARRICEAIGRSVTFEECLQLAEAQQPAALAVVQEAGAGLGRLLAAICNLTLPERIIVAGEGVRLAHVARSAWEAGLAGDRDPRASTPPILLASGDNEEWCRGAAVLAIQHFVGGDRAV